MSKPEILAALIAAILVASGWSMAAASRRND
jgi:lambda repressor-like predicted transcriptional regulator